MASTGITYASSAGSVGLSVPPWLNTSNATGSEDGSDSSCTLSTASGIPVDLGVQLHDNGSNFGTDLADTGTSWPTSVTAVRYGGDLRSTWGIGGQLTPAIANSTLGVKIRVRIPGSPNSDTAELRASAFNWTDIPSDSIIDSLTLWIWRHYAVGRGTRICLIDAVAVSLGYHAARNPWSQRWRL